MTDTATCIVQHAFAPRPTSLRDIREIAGYRMKLYTITLPGEEIDWPVYEEGLREAARVLPSGPTDGGRFGAGFVICHQGAGIHYIVCCWWARENELPIRVFVRESKEGATWRAAEGDESVCVWDLDVIKREREAFVETVLASAGEADVEAYLARR